MMGVLERDEMLLQCRINAAFNFPAMSAFFVSMPQQQSGVNSRGMANSFAALCRDSHPLVRKTIAAGFHEVMIMMMNIMIVLGMMMGMMMMMMITVIM